jgi:hypothetical protein
LIDKVALDNLISNLVLWGKWIGAPVAWLYFLINFAVTDVVVHLFALMHLLGLCAFDVRDLDAVSGRVDRPLFGFRAFDVRMLNVVANEFKRRRGYILE